MVLTPAPRTRRPNVNTMSFVQTGEHWTNRFRKASATRTNRKIALWTLASCAILLPNSLSTRSEADQLGLIQLPPVGTSQTDNTTVSSSQPGSPQPATPILSASASSQSPSQHLSSSEPSSDTRSDARPEIQSGVTAPLAAPAASHHDAAPLSQSAAPAEPSSAIAQPQMRIRVIESGKERQSQIAVTPKMTVGQALAAMGISLVALDRVMPDASALARDGQTIRITHIAAKLEKRHKAIPTELRYKPTTIIKPGTKQIVQQARPGILEITERVWTRDGKETKREFVSQRVAAQPQNQIVALGVTSNLMPGNVPYHSRYANALSFRGGTPRDRMLAPANPGIFAPVRSLTVVTTGYAAGRAGGSIGTRTCTGVRCGYGAVAVDPRVIPLGSRLYIEGYGYGFACDIGGAIKGKHIDLAFDSARAANDHGRQHAKIWILAP